MTEVSCLPPPNSLTGSKILDGKRLAKRIQGEMRDQIRSLEKRGYRRPGLAVLLIGEDPASQVYVRNKQRACASVGIESTCVTLSANTSLDAVLAQIDVLNSDPQIDGILCQLPLPTPLRPETERLLQTILPEKDVDGLHPFNRGLLAQGLAEGIVPCTPWGILELLRETGVDLVGKTAVVLGRSALVGRPLSDLLLRENMTVVNTHSSTRDLPNWCRQADVLIAATGRIHLVQRDWIRPSAILIDVGIHRLQNGKLTGDINPEAAEQAAYVTPVPGGVGPMTITGLLHNTLRLYKRREGIYD